MAFFIAGMKDKERAGPHGTCVLQMLPGHTRGSTRKVLGRQKDKKVLLKMNGIEEGIFSSSEIPKNLIYFFFLPSSGPTEKRDQRKIKPQKLKSS